MVKRMAGELRIECSETAWQITSRGNAREKIHNSDQTRENPLQLYMERDCGLPGDSL